MAYGKAYGLFYFSKSDGPFVGARVLSLSLEGKGKEILNDLKTLVVMGPAFYIISNYSLQSMSMTWLTRSHKRLRSPPTQLFSPKDLLECMINLPRGLLIRDAHSQQSHACLAPCCTL